MEKEGDSDECRCDDGGAATYPGCVIAGPRSLELNANKAGMEGLDTERINRIVKEVSEGSNFYKHQQKRQQRIDKRVEEFQKALSTFTELQIQEATKKMDELCATLESARDLSRTIVHVDMDAFYAAVEMRDDPSLRDKPMAVGGLSMLCTSNYIARRFGIRAAMPGFIALKLCPELQMVPPNFDKYRAVSSQVRKIFADYDPNFCHMSLDEAYLDITDYLSQKTDQEVCAVVCEMRKRIQDVTQLTASAGIAPNMMLAKVCSDQNKPNGQFELPSERQEVMAFVTKLPIRKVSGIGNVTEQLLNSLGVCTCGDLMEKRGVLTLLFSSLSSHGFMEITLGIGSTHLGGDSQRKSKSVERTFDNTSDVAQLKNWCQELSDDLADDLKSEHLLGKTVTLKLKTTSYEVKTRAISLPYPTNECSVIVAAALKLLQNEIKMVAPKLLSLRLMGVRMSSFVSDSDPSVLKRQCTLQHLLEKNRANTQQQNESLVCPLCSSVDFTGLRELQGHVERCLESGGHSNGTEGEDEVKCEDDEPPPPPPSTELRGAESLPQPADGVEQAEYCCPVCDKTLTFNCLTAFNTHVDVCLNRDTVNMLVKAESVVVPTPSSKGHKKTPTRNKRKRRSGAIETYFKKT